MGGFVVLSRVTRRSGAWRRAGWLRVWVLLAILVSQVALAPAQSAHAVVPPGPGSGDRFYKLAVTQSGMHKVTYEVLAGAGLPVDTLAPATFQLFEQGQEMARDVVDADSSGAFSAGDYILFYAHPVDTYFTNVNLYWLTYGGGAGLPMALRDATPQVGLPPSETFTETVHVEQNMTWQRGLPVDGETDRWYWALYRSVCSLTSPRSATFTTTINTPGLAPGALTATLTPRLRGFPDGVQPFLTHQAIFDVNGTVVGQGAFLNTSEFWQTFSFTQTAMVETGNVVRLTAPPCPAPNTNDLGLVNSFELTYQRTYTAPVSGQFAFAVDLVTPAAVTLTGVGAAATEVFDISDPRRPVRLVNGQITAAAAQATVSFAHTLNAAARYIAAAPAQLLTPTISGPDTPSNLRNAQAGADWIVISPALLMPEAERLAAHRRSTQNLRTAVVDVQDVYDEFNGGLTDQEAIRTFIRYAYENWPRPASQYVVLMGDGHYDPRNFLRSPSPGPYHIPPYLAAVDPIDGVTAADNRYVAYDPVAPVQYPVPFMHLGRLPANTLAEATAMVDKTIAYETTPTVGGWNKNVLFVADDADNGGDFSVSSNIVYSDTTLLPADYNRQRAYYTIDYASPTSVTDVIVNAINNGVLFINYHGHGSQQRWSGEPLIQTSNFSRLTNAGKYPIMLPMTCLEGFFINPEATKQGFGESIVKKANAGAVASWSPTGKGIANGHDILYEALYEAIFQLGMTELGPVTTYAKAQLGSSPSRFKDLIDTYILFGDPALTINVPAANPWLRKELTPESAPRPGAPVTYTLSYGNSGDLAAAGVVVTDVLPAALISATWSASDPAVAEVPGVTYAWQLPALAPGASGVITLYATIDPAFLGLTLTNSATVSGMTAEKLATQGDNDSQVARGMGVQSGTLRGLVFADINSNSVPDGPEVGMSGVTIQVFGPGNVLLGSPVSDALGVWTLDLPLGTYTVTVPMNPYGYQLTTGGSQVVTLSAPGDTALASGFGYVLPTGMELEYFRAARVSRAAVVVEWATRSETDISTFAVYRSMDPLNHGESLTPASIPAAAPPGGGWTYSITDSQLPTGGRPLYYWLEVVSRGAGVYWFGPAVVTQNQQVLLPLISRR